MGVEVRVVVEVEAEMGVAVRVEGAVLEMGVAVRVEAGVLEVGVAVGVGLGDCCENICLFLEQATRGTHPGSLPSPPSF